MKTKRLLIATCLILATTVGRAQDASKKAPEPEKPVVVSHTASIGGAEIKFITETGKLELKADDGKVKAKIFYVAYRKEGVTDVSKRPITFTFNGGPGSASVWLHLGMAGPQRIRFPDDAKTLRPPYKLEANPHSLLDLTDLVFIDPVSTGLSLSLIHI